MTYIYFLSLTACFILIEFSVTVEDFLLEYDAYLYSKVSY